MLRCLSVSCPSQAVAKRTLVCCGHIALFLAAIILFGSLQETQAAEDILSGHRVHAAPTKDPLQLAANCPRAARIAATLAGAVNAGPQGGALPTAAAAQSGMVTLRGNTRPEAVAKNDRGRAADDLALDHMMLQLQRTPGQEQALQQFINDLHDPASPLFHHWITAAEFGQRYGAAPADVAKVTNWLESQGFKVNLVYPNQMVIDFTGSAGQIRQAFHTEIHHLHVNGEDHIANVTDPLIPTTLASVLAGVVSLNDFRPQLLAGGGLLSATPRQIVPLPRPA